MKIFHSILSAEPTLWKEQFKIEKEVEVDSDTVSKKLDKVINSYKAIELACALRKTDAGKVLEVSFYLPSSQSKSEVDEAVSLIVLPLTRPSYFAAYKKVSTALAKLDKSDKYTKEALESFLKE